MCLDHSKVHCERSGVNDLLSLHQTELIICTLKVISWEGMKVLQRVHARDCLQYNCHWS